MNGFLQSNPEIAPSQLLSCIRLPMENHTLRLPDYRFLPAPNLKQKRIRRRWSSCPAFLCSWWQRHTCTGTNQTFDFTFCSRGFLAAVLVTVTVPLPILSVPLSLSTIIFCCVYNRYAPLCLLLIHFPGV